jgi:Secretion system C-terminal sorting domain
MTGTGTLNIFSGTGTAGALLQTQTVTVSGTGNFFQQFFVSAPVTAGSHYTFQFVPTQGGGLPSPYGVQAVNPGTYSGGEFNITDPSGTSPMGMDLVFKTYVSTATGIHTTDQLNNDITVSPNPFHSQTTITIDTYQKNTTYKVLNILGETILQSVINSPTFNLELTGTARGLYFVQILNEGKIISSKRIIVN